MNSALNNTWTKGDVYHFKDESWSSLKTSIKDLDTLRDIISVTVDPNINDKIYLKLVIDNIP
ncbi:MAG: hypothetical protein IH823_07480 [Candidatus Dadabacteria bacterium]|nr:hypothetical protein [Candidatus Dadabacteria bacterium]